MSIRAGSIVTVAGRNVVDRLQSAGLGDARIPIETIREIGNDLVVDKVPGEADFTFTMESWDVTTDLIAFLHGKIGNQVVGQPPGYDYTETIVAADTGQSAVVTITFNTPPANLAQVRLAYFTETAKAYPQAVNADATVKPGAVRGRNVVIFVGTRGVNEVQSLTVDATGGNYTLGFNGYNTANLTPASTAAAVQAALEALPSIGAGNITVTGGPGGAGGGTPYVITFVGALGGTNVSAITSTNVSLAGGASTAVVTTTTPGGTGGNRVRLPGVQTFELEATVEGEVEREMGNEEITGRSVNGTDATGTVTFRPKDIDGFFTLLSTVTGVGTNEVYGYFNDHSVPVEIQIRNPKNPAQILKTIYMSDGQFQPPGTPARVNSPTDFATAFNSVNGTYSEFKGARP
jgi:hypothetical protein